VEGLTQDATAIAAGGSHTCAITTDGGVRCWGNNEDGQLGNGTDVSSSTPVDVVGLRAPTKAIAAGEGYTCALGAAGGVQCWGENEEGQLGNATLINSAQPVDVFRLSRGAAAIAAGSYGYHTCALMERSRAVLGREHPGPAEQRPKRPRRDEQQASLHRARREHDWPDSERQP
jgi:hypothetical protein